MVTRRDDVGIASDSGVSISRVVGNKEIVVILLREEIIDNVFTQILHVLFVIA